MTPARVRLPGDHGGPERTVTVTFGYGRDDLRVVVAANIKAAFAQAERRWGDWQTLESISTPDTIYADLSGETQRKWSHIKGEGNQTEADKLARALGRRPRPGEIGAFRYGQDRLQRLGRKLVPGR